MESWTAVEWLMVIVVVVGLIALYVKRDKVKTLLGGGGWNDGDVKPRRK